MRFFTGFSELIDTQVKSGYYGGDELGWCCVQRGRVLQKLKEDKRIGGASQVRLALGSNPDDQAHRSAMI